MKRSIKILAATLMIAIIISSVSVFAVANQIVINGTVAEIPVDMGQIREKDERTFVPLRFVSEFLEYNVWYDETTRVATVESQDRIIFVQDGNNTLFIVSKITNATENIDMDTAAYIEESEGRTYLPIRFLAQAMGYDVGWDDVTGTVSLNKAE